MYTDDSFRTNSDHEVMTAKEALELAKRSEIEGVERGIVNAAENGLNECVFRILFDETKKVFESRGFEIKEIQDTVSTTFSWANA